MRENDRNPLRIIHMVEAIERLLRFLNDKSVDDLKNDEVLFFGVIKNIEILGEAAYMLTLEFRDNHPNIPWKKIIGMRHVLVHDYYRISHEEVFKVYQNDLTPLLSQLKEIQESI